MEEKSYKVSSTSNVKKLASCIAKTLIGEDANPPCSVALHCCGASAINQAVKATAVARGYVAVCGRDLSIKPGFDTILVDGKERTIIKLFISLA